MNQPTDPNFRSLAIITQQPDSGWHGVIDPAHKPGFVIDLDKAQCRSDRPHPANLPGWLKWLTQNQVQQIDLYQPDGRGLAIVSAAAIKQLNIVVHLTGYANSRTLAVIKQIAGQVTHVVCPADFVAQQMRRINIDRRKIIITPPDISALSEPTIAKSELIASIAHSSPADVTATTDQYQYILALGTCDNTQALHHAVFTTVMLYHALTHVKLIINSPCSSQQRDLLNSWQQSWLAPNIVHIDTDCANWTNWLNAVDCLLAPPHHLRELTRLLYAQQSPIPIIASGVSAKLLASTANSIIASGNEPQEYAQAILQTLALHS
ncbi:MAG: hypothetical protein JW936_06895 [Sedimentisphaerales bacterium]|nr:hypothetical protein [Sedimentisphaerales bacterium]